MKKFKFFNNGEQELWERLLPIAIIIGEEALNSTNRHDRIHLIGNDHCRFYDLSVSEYGASLTIQYNDTEYIHYIKEWEENVWRLWEEQDREDEDELISETVLNSIEPEERNFVEEMIRTASVFSFDDDYINRKIYNSRYGRVRYLDHIELEGRNYGDDSYMVLATKRELDTISHNTNNIWITVVRYDNRRGNYYIHDRVVMNGEGIRLNNVPYVITL